MTGENKDGLTIPVRFDGRIFGLDAIKKAAYRYINYFSVDMSLNGDETLCLLKFASTAGEATQLRIVEEFKKEVLDQDLRERIKLETEGVRNLILAHAFSKTGVVEGEQVPEN